MSKSGTAFIELMERLAWKPMDTCPDDLHNVEYCAALTVTRMRKGIPVQTVRTYMATDPRPKDCHPPHAWRIRRESP